MKRFWAALVLASASTMAAAQAPAAPTPAEADAARQFRELKWLQPGGTGKVAGKAEFKASANFTFLDAADTDKFLTLNGNPPQGGGSYTVAPVKGSWFGVLRYADEGYIKDDEKIDADALLKQLKEQNAQSNEAKRKQGYSALVIEGWALPPRYDAQSKRLEWGTRLRSESDNAQVVNVSTRILGRGGYTSAVLVTSPQTMEADLAEFKVALKDFDYVQGERYSEWREGDKVAAYGLGALVLGGAAAVATSKGGFKAIGLAIAAAAAAAWAGIKKFMGRSKT